MTDLATESGRSDYWKGVAPVVRKVDDASQYRGR